MNVVIEMRTWDLWGPYQSYLGSVMAYTIEQAWRAAKQLFGDLVLEVELAD
jgi:hypothetical protein